MSKPDILSYPLPPVTRTSSGDCRRVGFELEFSGITLEQAVAALRQALPGEIAEETAAMVALEVGGLGKFIIELDWDYLKRKAAGTDAEYTERRWLAFVSRAAALVVPVEVVCPPIPIQDLARLEPMLSNLRTAGAVGTEESLLAAYGAHINTEIPALDSNTLNRYLQAYALLQWWLVDAQDVDPTRRLIPYIDLYPEAYLNQILSRSDPRIDQIFDDYLEHNATRNRALDLLPILKEIDPSRIECDADDPSVKARPAFHYRLPNCSIEREDWPSSLSWRT